MSKLNDAICVAQKERVAISQPAPMIEVETEVKQPQANIEAVWPGYSDAYRYTITATIGATAECPASALGTVEETVRRQIAEEVFGEFRKPLLQARLAAFTSKPQEAVSIIDDIFDRMFGVSQHHA